MGGYVSCVEQLLKLSGILSFIPGFTCECRAGFVSVTALDSAYSLACPDIYHKGEIGTDLVSSSSSLCASFRNHLSKVDVCKPILPSLHERLPSPWKALWTILKMSHLVNDATHREKTVLVLLWPPAIENSLIVFLYRLTQRQDWSRRVTLVRLLRALFVAYPLLFHFRCAYLDAAQAVSNMAAAPVRKCVAVILDSLEVSYYVHVVGMGQLLAYPNETITLDKFLRRSHRFNT